MIEEKLARLNAKTVRFDIGRGGVPELTPQDIAAGLAMVRAGLGREILIAVGWPDGADMRKLMEMACEMAHAELRRQHEAITRAGIRHALDNWHGKRSQPTLPAHWPRSAYERLPAIVSACVSEISKRHLCPDCEGRKEVMRGDLRTPCQTCKQTGVVPVSDRKRAGMIGLDESTYRRNGWADVYVWMMTKMQDAHAEAAREFGRALAA